MTIHRNGIVKIADNNHFVPDITILTGSHEIGNHYRRAGDGVKLEYKIGSGNWIGAESTLVNGCQIGDGVIVRACALVTKDCEDDHLYLAVPC